MVFFLMSQTSKSTGRIRNGDHGTSTFLLNPLQKNMKPLYQSCIVELREKVIEQERSNSAGCLRTVHWRQAKRPIEQNSVLVTLCRRTSELLHM